MSLLSGSKLTIVRHKLTNDEFFPLILGWVTVETYAAIKASYSESLAGLREDHQAIASRGGSGRIKGTVNAGALR